MAHGTWHMAHGTVDESLYRTARGVESGTVSAVEPGSVLAEA